MPNVPYMLYARHNEAYLSLSRNYRALSPFVKEALWLCLRDLQIAKNGIEGEWTVTGFARVCWTTDAATSFGQSYPMETYPEPRVTSAERMNGGVFITFDDRKCALLLRVSTAPCVSAS